MSANSQPEPDRDRLEAATDQAIAACGGDARDAATALIVANEFLAAQMEKLKADVSSGYARGYYHGRFKTYTADRSGDDGRSDVLRRASIYRQR
ncbi:MAG TPA: hypothetical protein VK602_18010 [Phyllobacterium sp.]|nr:hypothetical protein [Phyllobacterium sp.]